MKRAVVILLFGLSWSLGFGQEFAISRTGQFIVNATSPGTSTRFVQQQATNKALVKLEPALVAVSCERIKQTLLNTLGVRDQWRGKIYLNLHPATAYDEEIMVTATRYNDGWKYQLSLPDVVDSDRFVRAITQVLLVEMANRQFPAQSAVLPTWLAEGLPQYLMAISGIDLVLKPVTGSRNDRPIQSVETRESRVRSPFAQARQRLRQQSPLTLEQLSHPETDGPTNPNSELYRDTALLFIQELLKLKNGGECLFALLPELSWDTDWRAGFLKGFQQHFPHWRNLQKWWALQTAYFAARDPNQLWTRAESIDKLEEILRIPFEVRLNPNDPTLYTDVSIQAIIKGWTMAQQSPELREKINLLRQLQLRVALELRPLIQQYSDVLSRYLDQMEAAVNKTKPTKIGRHPLAAARPKPARAPDENDPVVKQTLAQLDVLDARCEDWKSVRSQLPGLAPGPPPP